VIVEKRVCQWQREVQEVEGALDCFHTEMMVYQVEDSHSDLAAHMGRSKQEVGSTMSAKASMVANQAVCPVKMA